MIAKAIRNRAPPGDDRQDFKARVTYVCTKASAIDLANLAGAWGNAAFQMRMTARLSSRLRSPVYHFVLSWAETERPSDEEVIRSAHRVVLELGAAEHQYVVAVHRDRVSIHAHIILNRVHPTTGSSWSASNDFARLERACRKVEHEMAWPPDRGRFDVELRAGEILLVPKPAQHWENKSADRTLGLRQDGRAVGGHEKRTGLPPLRDTFSQAIMGNVRMLIDQARTWHEVHRSLSLAGLRYVLRGVGARISGVTSGWSMPACHLGTGYGLRRMESRLGRFLPGKGQEGVIAADLAPTDTISATPRASEVHASQMRARRDKGGTFPSWRNWFQTARRSLLEVHRDERNRVRHFLRGSRSPFAQALRRVQREEHRKQLAKLKGLRPLRDLHPRDTSSRRTGTDLRQDDARRFRHVLRDASAKPGSFLEANRRDHTFFRQQWTLSSAQDDRHIPEALAAILLRHREDLRISGEGDVLLARRWNGSITGFHVMPWDHAAGCDAGDGAATGLGLGFIGHRDAQSCVVVPDVSAGLVQAALTGKEDTLIIIAGREIDESTAHSLKRVTRGRTIFVAFGADPKYAQAASALRRVLPDARWGKRNPGDLLQDFLRPLPPGNIDGRSDLSTTPENDDTGP